MLWNPLLMRVSRLFVLGENNSAGKRRAAALLSDSSG